MALEAALYGRTFWTVISAGLSPLTQDKVPSTLTQERVWGPGLTASLPSSGTARTIPYVICAGARCVSSTSLVSAGDLTSSPYTAGPADRIGYLTYQPRRRAGRPRVSGCDSQKARARATVVCEPRVMVGAGFRDRAPHPARRKLATRSPTPCLPRSTAGLRDPVMMQYQSFAWTGARTTLSLLGLSQLAGGQPAGSMDSS